MIEDIAFSQLWLNCGYVTRLRNIGRRKYPICVRTGLVMKWAVSRTQHMKMLTCWTKIARHIWRDHSCTIRHCKIDIKTWVDSQVALALAIARLWNHGIANKRGETRPNLRQLSSWCSWGMRGCKKYSGWHYQKCVRNHWSQNNTMYDSRTHSKLYFNVFKSI